MIEINSKFRSKYASVIRKARTERIRCVRLEPDLYYVARREAGHGQYLVRFFNKGQSVTAVCADIFNQACRGTIRRGSCCTHVAAAYERCIQRGFRETRKEAA